jgi:thiopurine S-methyltransferase
MMDRDFWHQRWHEGRIGFHQGTVTPLLEKHWPTMVIPPGARVFVPLCGKSLDLAWLAAQGHEVLGVELSPIAVEQFFDEHELAPEVSTSRYGRHHRAGGIELICGDAFDLDEHALAGCAAFYDRAALIALPEDLRRVYAQRLYPRLPPDCGGLLIGLEYPPREMSGPPFPVSPREVRALYGRDWSIDVLERSDILAQQRNFAAEGVSSLHTAAYRMQRRPASAPSRPG